MEVAFWDLKIDKTYKMLIVFMFPNTYFTLENMMSINRALLARLIGHCSTLVRIITQLFIQPISCALIFYRTDETV